jgi:elongation factor P--(R)-beta-lysine ligase
MPLNWALSCKRGTLEARARIIRDIRRFFNEGGYLEVETPLRIPAPAPESQIDAVPSGDWFLHTSPELCMKRLMAAGCERVFQICRCWRDGERGRLHLPEFTMLEWYRAGTDYLGLMDECELLVRSLAVEMGLGGEVVYRGQRIELAGRWERITVRDAFSRFGGTPMETALARGTFDEVMVERIEPRLGTRRPTFIHDYPAERSALARLHADDPTVSERFELYIGGIELANAFSELTDPTEQSARFRHEASIRKSLGRRSYPLPGKFLDELANMPPSAGIALGIDRLVMVLLNKTSIDDVVSFTPEDL